jgi:hypothetical protein
MSFLPSPLARCSDRLGAEYTDELSLLPNGSAEYGLNIKMREIGVCELLSPWIAKSIRNCNDMTSSRE